MLHQPYAGVVADTIGKEPVDERYDPTKEVGSDRQGELGQQQCLQPIEQAGAQPSRESSRTVRQMGKVHDLVDDELAHEQRRHRQKRSHQPHGDRRGGKTPAATPYHGEEGR